VEEPDLPTRHREVVAERKVAQPLALALAELGEPPPERLAVVVAVGVGEEVVPVAEDVDLAALLAQVDHLATTRTLADVVAQVEDPFDAAGVDVGEHGVECSEVAVHVGDQCDAVERAW
jgi:hypothetical protein